MGHLQTLSLLFTKGSREHSRALLRPQFSRGQVSDLSLEERHVQNLLKRLKVDAGADVWSEEVDLAPLFFNLTLDTATEFLFGVSVLSQIGEEYASAPPANDWSNFGRCFDAAHFTTVSRARLMDLYWLYNPKSFRANCRAVHKCVDHFVDLALRGSHEKLAMDDGGAEKHYTFLQELVKLTQDPLELRGNLLHILMAGRDTTAGLLGWIFYLLARHPSVYEKLRQTILADFGPFSSDTDRITFESLKACHYLQHVISETLRLYSVVPESMRTAVRDTKLPRGGGTDGKSPIYVRRGETVIYNMNIMHRREDLWGEDAHEFKPERWDHRRQGWDYLPFSGGPRICLGQQFALTEAGYVVVRMLQKFDRLDNLDQHEEPRHRFMSTTSPVEVSVRLRQATTH